MVANVLIITFVSAFCVIAMLGHVLLIVAVWPDLISSRLRQANAKMQLNQGAASPHPDFPRHEVLA